MQRLEVSGAVRPIYGSLGVKRLIHMFPFHYHGLFIIIIIVVVVVLLFPKVYKTIILQW